MTEYLRLLPTILWILTVFGLVFSVVAGVAKRLRGPRMVWVVWVAYSALVCVSCVIGLSRLEGASSGAIARLVYYTAVAAVSIGFPLWCSARALLALAERRPPIREPWQVAGAWAVSVATAPIGLVLVFGVDRIADALQWSPFAS
ncbi:MAG TPA: hypothetical protein VF215_13750 [Thermoanaerobaculia bacterium]